MVSEQVESNPVAPPAVAPGGGGAVPAPAPTSIEPAPRAEVADRSRAVVVVWLAAVIGFVLFVALASVSREAGRVGGRVRVTRAWSSLADNLPDGAAVQAVFWGAVALFLAAAGVALWLALTTGTTDTTRSAVQPSDRE